MAGDEGDLDQTNHGDPALAQKAKRSRAGAKTWLSRSRTDLEKLLADGETPDIVSLEEGLAELEKRISVYEKTQAEVELHIPDEELEGDIFQEASFLIPAKDVRLKAIKAIRALNKPTNANGNLDDDASSNSSRVRKQHVKVPKIDIPPFYGGYL